jgi:hypothetical protein
MNDLSMPGFTAEMSLYNMKKLGGYYGMMLMDASASRNLVIGQQLGGISPLRTFLELENCTPCVRSGSTVRCDVIKVSPFSITPRAFLGTVILPKACSNCWNPCPPS